MDFTTFREKLANDELKSITARQDMLDHITAKYQEVDILGCYRLNENHTCISFKHKLWHKMAIYREGDWLETRVNSLKNQLPDETLAALLKNLKAGLHIVKVESILPSEGIFYFYVVCKISGKKYVLHVTREGEILLRSKYLEYTITIDDEEDEEDDDDMDGEDEDEELEEVGEELEYDDEIDD